MLCVIFYQCQQNYDTFVLGLSAFQAPTDHSGKVLTNLMGKMTILEGVNVG